MNPHQDEQHSHGEQGSEACEGHDQLHQECQVHTGQEREERLHGVRFSARFSGNVIEEPSLI